MHHSKILRSRPKESFLKNWEIRQGLTWYHEHLWKKLWKWLDWKHVENSHGDDSLLVLERGEGLALLLHVCPYFCSLLKKFENGHGDKPVSFTLRSPFEIDEKCNTVGERGKWWQCNTVGERGKWGAAPGISSRWGPLETGGREEENDLEVFQLNEEWINSI